jgi:polyisoprenoid-binding protein YceI
MFAFAALLVLTGCDDNTELAQPIPPPIPMTVTAAESAQVKLSGSLDVVAVKNGTAEVAATLQVLDGELALNDQDAWTGASGKVEVALTSFDSLNPLRDERVRNLLLQVGLQPTAVFELTGVSGLPSEGIPVGGTATGNLSGQVTLAGVTQAVIIPVSIERQATQAWRITTVESVGLSLSSFGLQEESDALKEECKHESIADGVRVSFQVVASAAPPAPAKAPPGE